MEFPYSDNDATPVFYNTTIEEILWKEEVMLEPCEVCKRQRVCFSAFLNNKAPSKVIKRKHEAIRNCTFRNEMIKEAFDNWNT